MKNSYRSKGLDSSIDKLQTKDIKVFFFNEQDKNIEFRNSNPRRNSRIE